MYLLLLLTFVGVRIYYETLQVAFFGSLLIGEVHSRNATQKLVNATLQRKAPSHESPQTLNDRFGKYLPTSDLSDFDRHRMSKLPFTHPLTVKTPIFVASLPKSGTSSIWKYFLCAGHMAAHATSLVNQTAAVRIGDCMERNIKNQNTQKPFHGCGPYYIWTDCGNMVDPPLRPHCFYPSIQALDSLYNAYPDMTILLMRRNATAWADSVRHFHQIAKRWVQCGILRNEEESLVQFYNAHTTRLREFAQAHPSMTYIELPLEGSDTGKQLEEAFGTPASCWKDCAPGRNGRKCIAA